MLTIAVDGSALGNPGPAGWAWYIDDSSWDAGGWDNATNNRGELMAVIQALQATQSTGQDIHLLADSQYVINSITKWMPGWKKKGWKKSDGKPVSNKDLMVELDRLMTEAKDDGRKISFEWVKGHANHPLNEAADARAHAAATAYKTKSTVPSGPGLNLETSCVSVPASTADTLDVSAQPQATVTVHCDLDKELADRIVAAAQQKNITPHQELAALIRTGVENSYN